MEVWIYKCQSWNSYFSSWNDCQYLSVCVETWKSTYTKSKDEVIPIMSDVTNTEAVIKACDKGRRLLHALFGMYYFQGNFNDFVRSSALYGCEVWTNLYYLCFRSTWVHRRFLVGFGSLKFSLMCIFCRSLFSFLSFFFWPLCYLFIFAHWNVSMTCVSLHDLILWNDSLDYSTLRLKLIGRNECSSRS